MADLKFNKESIGLFAAGLVLGKFGKEFFGGAKAKDKYVKATVMALRAKDLVTDKVSVIQDNVQDIYAEAKEIRNEEIEAEIREEDEDVYEDLSDDEMDFLEEIPDEEE